MCKGRIILFWLSVRGKPCVLRSAVHAVPVPTLHCKTHSRHALPISGQLDIFAAGSFCVAGNRQQLRCIPVSYTSNKQRHSCGWLLLLSAYQPSASPSRICWISAATFWICSARSASVLNCEGFRKGSSRPSPTPISANCSSRAAKRKQADRLRSGKSESLHSKCSLSGNPAEQH